MLSLILDHSGDAAFDDTVMDSVPLEYYLPVLNHIIMRQNAPRVLPFVHRIFENFPYQAVFPILYARKSDRTRHNHQYLENSPVIVAAKAFIRGIRQLTVPLDQYCARVLRYLQLEVAQNRPPHETLEVIEKHVNHPKSPYDDRFLKNHSGLAQLIGRFFELVKSVRSIDFPKRIALGHEDEVLHYSQAVQDLLTAFQVNIPSTYKLHDLAPALCRWDDHRFPVFGTVVGIEKFGDDISVLGSKQRPRRLIIRGTDGRDYAFIAKAYEDLEMDNRTMLFFP
jgi:hypothetical protein